MSDPNYREIAPDSVRVWRGYKAKKEDLDDFYKNLGEIFIPSCIKLQMNAGIHSYLPTVTAGLSGKPPSIPDETALVFYESQEEYKKCFTKLPVRSYMLNHRAVFAMKESDGDYLSKSSFPEFFKGELKDDTPVYLFEKPADWMYGNTVHLIAELPPEKESKDFIAKNISETLTKIQQNSKINGAIACIGNNYFVYWETSPLIADGTSPGIQLLDGILTDWKKIINPESTDIDGTIWDEYSGIKVKYGSSFNFKFERAKTN